MYIIICDAISNSKTICLIIIGGGFSTGFLLLLKRPAIGIITRNSTLLSDNNTRLTANWLIELGYIFILGLKKCNVKIYSFLNSDLCNWQNLT